MFLLALGPPYDPEWTVHQNCLTVLTGPNCSLAHSPPVVRQVDFLYKQDAFHLGDVEIPATSS